jgi:hypothetical protein
MAKFKTGDVVKPIDGGAVGIVLGIVNDWVKVRVGTDDHYGRYSPHDLVRVCDPYGNQ